AERDPIKKMREWMLKEGIATADELDALEQNIRREVEEIREQAWQALHDPLRAEARELAGLIEALAQHSAHAEELHGLARALAGATKPQRRQMFTAIRSALLRTQGENTPERTALLAWKNAKRECNRERYGSHLYSQSDESPLHVQAIAPRYGAEPEKVRGFELLRANFDAWLAKDPRVCIFGEDVGGLGDVNQGTTGLQQKYGKLRVSDTGIRETTIVGQAVGMALRGLRPIAEIQYLDYILYALPTLSDDLATLHWRTRGGQKAPAIIRTRGHRLEGIWHAGSPMGALLNSLRGMHILVPRDMTRAAGFYNTLLQSDDPALVVEVLNGYRLHEELPENLGEFTVPLGVPEILRPGDDVTLVTYGACCRIALEAAEELEHVGVDVEVIDVQSLLPFDIHGMILESLKKTGRIVFLDEDVPGGGSAFMLQQVIERQGGYWHLDSPPQTVTSQPHRPAYGSDGDYFSKPNVDDVFEAVYALMQEADPAAYPEIFANV
ncbi:MAG TPA: transketolase C-terminal domain-containing protein, partial [Roseiflexaceae bacterium]|nr:transketolase C-terminal domain-containing protein [Roseiflexaceae bacterium]